MHKEQHILINQKRREFEFFGFARPATVSRGETVGWLQLPHRALEAYQSMDWALDRSSRNVPITIPTFRIPGQVWNQLPPQIVEGLTFNMPISDIYGKEVALRLAATLSLGRPPRLPFSREAFALTELRLDPPSLPICCIHRREPKAPRP
jgi:hypothetical protein